jgi:DNA-binding IclR family transcriptional regulator
VLETIASDPTARLRDIALTVGITERTAAQIVNDLEEAATSRRSGTDGGITTRSTRSYPSGIRNIDTTLSAS